MFETNLKESEEYDARLLDDSTFVQPAPSRKLNATESSQTAEVFESPFLVERGSEVIGEMEEPSPVHECHCGGLQVMSEALAQTETANESEELEAFEGESEAHSCSEGCPEPSKDYLRRIRRKGDPRGGVIDRTEGNRTENLWLQLTDYDVNEYRLLKEQHRDALVRIREFIVDRTVQTDKPIAVTITGSASRTGGSTYNDVLSCRRAECAADNLRTSLSFFRGVAERVQINPTGEGFTRATCRGADCELGEWRSLLIQVHSPSNPPHPIPPVDPGWDKYTIRCCSFHTKTLVEAALDELLKRAFPNVPPSVNSKIITTFRKAFVKLVQQLEKQLPQVGSALKGFEELLKLFPGQFIQETGTFELRERGKLDARGMVLCYSGFGLRITVPTNLDDFLDLAIDKTVFKGLPDVVKKALKEGIKKAIPRVVVDNLRPIESDSPGPTLQFDLLHPRSMMVFPGSVQIGKGIWMPGRVNVEFDSQPWRRPDPRQRPHITKCPNICPDDSGLQPVVGEGKGIEFFSISAGDLKSGPCACAVTTPARELETEMPAELQTEIVSETETEAASEAEAESETEALTFGDGQENLADETEAFETDPYASIRSAFSPEHSNLSAEEVTVVLGGLPAAVTLHQMLSSPATRQATMALLLRKGARRTVQVNGSNVSIPAYLRVMSRLCREVAEEYDAPAGGQKPGSGSRGIEKYRDDVSRQNYYAFFKSAIQGVAGKSRLTAQKKAALADSIADSAVSRFRTHADQMNCALAAVTDPNSTAALSRALNLSGPWGDAFNGALQTTSGGDYRVPSQPVQSAAELADQAVFAGGQLDENLWKAYMKCGRP